MDQTVEHFAVLAQSYCSLVVDRTSHSRSAFVAQLRPLLLDLYSTALTLPDRWVDHDLQLRAQSTEEWMALYQSLGEYLGDWSTYHEVFDPYELDEPVTGSLADDIADIYRDLRRGLDLRLIDHPLSSEAALWEWRFHFYAHWGEHLTGALRPLHRLLEEAESANANDDA